MVLLDARFHALAAGNQELQRRAQALAREQRILALLLDRRLDAQRRAEEQRLDVARGEQLALRAAPLPAGAHHAAGAGEVAEIETQ